MGTAKVHPISAAKMWEKKAEAGVKSDNRKNRADIYLGDDFHFGDWARTSMFNDITDNAS